LILTNNVHDAVLAGFGFAAVFSEECFSDQFIDSQSYCAPEIWKESEYNENVNMWPLGMTMFACLAAMFPFD
jgi:serine/threonine protein kinase